MVLFTTFVQTKFRRVWVTVECRGSRVISRGSRVIGRGSNVEVEGQKSRSRVKSRGRGSKVEVEGQKSRLRVKSRGSKVENTKSLSILKVLQPLNVAKQLVLLSKLKNFAYGYAVWNYACKILPPTSFASLSSFKRNIKDTYKHCLDAKFDIDMSCTWTLVPDCCCHNF